MEMTLQKLTIPPNAYILVADGQKALFLRNEGDEKFPNLRTAQVFSDDNPPAHEQGSDRPGRSFARAGTNRRGAMETTDWHQIEEHRFAQRIAATLEQLVRTGGVTAIAIVAPPRTLADLRQALHQDVKSRIFAEIDKDLTKHPIHEIERHLTG
jgi:protein required for attachment to host cells